MPLLTLALVGPAAAGNDRLPPGAASCLECHAGTGPGGSDGPTRLDALTPEAIATALAAFRSGRRPGTIMPRIAPGFSVSEAAAIAEALGRPQTGNAP